MSKRLCKDSGGLEESMIGKKMKYRCTNCNKQSPKEKWCCKPAKIKQ